MSKLRFYSKEENAIVNKFVKSGKPVNKDLIGDFCKKYDRPYLSVLNKVYQSRKRLRITNSKKQVKNVSPKAKLVKDRTIVNLSKSEFKIPITNWNVSSEDGQFYFIVKF